MDIYLYLTSECYVDRGGTIKKRFRLFGKFDKAEQYLKPWHDNKKVQKMLDGGEIFNEDNTDLQITLQIKEIDVPDDPDILCKLINKFKNNKSIGNKIYEYKWKHPDKEKAIYPDIKFDVEEEILA